MPFIETLYTHQRKEPKKLLIAKRATAIIFLILIGLYIAGIVYDTIIDVPSVKTLYNANALTLSMPHVYLCPNSELNTEAGFNVVVNCQFASLADSSLFNGNCPTEQSARSLNVVKSAGWNTQACVRVRLDQATDTNNHQIVYGNPNFANDLTGTTYTSGVTLNINLTSAYNPAPTVTLGVWVFPSEYDPEDDDPNSLFNQLTDAPSQYDSPIGNQFVLEQNKQMFLFFFPSTLTYTRATSRGLEVLGLPPSKATFSEYSISPVVFSQPPGTWGSVTVQPASFTVLEKRLQRNYTVLSLLALVGGNVGFWAALFVVLYGQERLTPWGLVQHYVPSIRKEITKQFLENYGQGPEQPLVGPDVNSGNVLDEKVTHAASSSNPGNNITKVVEVLADRVRHLEEVLGENFLNVDYLRLEQQKLANRRSFDA